MATAKRRIENEEIVEKTAAEIKSEELEKQVADLTDKLNALTKLLANATAPAAPVAQLAKEEPDAIVISRSFGETCLETPDHTISILFPCGTPIAVAYEDMKALLRDSSVRKYKPLFEKDLLYFVNENDYERFGIKKKQSLSAEEIQEILFKPNIDDTIREIRKITNDLHNQSIKHYIIYKIVEMLVDPEKPLRSWEYENRLALEKLFGIKFDQLIEYSGIWKLLRDNR